MQETTRRKRAGRGESDKERGLAGSVGPPQPDPVFATYIHGNLCDDEELRLIADSGGTTSIAPTVEMLMGHGLPPAARMLAHGLRPSLSIDVVTGSPSHTAATAMAGAATGRVATPEVMAAPATALATTPIRPATLPRIAVHMSEAASPTAVIGPTSSQTIIEDTPKNPTVLRRKPRTGT